MQILSMRLSPVRANSPAAFLACWLCLVAVNALSQTSNGASSAQFSPGAIGPGNVIVQSKFGGQIFGFDIDQNGTEGVLTEAQTLPDGRVLAAVETFDQATGKIVKVVKRLRSKDDFITLGIVGTSVGLVEREHVKGIFLDWRIYSLLNPLTANTFTGTWTPPLQKDDIITTVSRSQGTSKTVFLGFENGGDNHTFVFSSDVAANTFGPKVNLLDDPFFFANTPSVAYDSKRNRAVVAASDGAVGGPPPVIALVDLATGKVTQFQGIPGAPHFGRDTSMGLQSIRRTASPARQPNWTSEWSSTISRQKRASA
jgi:hypothetical protein